MEKVMGSHGISKAQKSTNRGCESPGSLLSLT